MNHVFIGTFSTYRGVEHISVLNAGDIWSISFRGESFNDFDSLEDALVGVGRIVKLHSGWNRNEIHNLEN